METARRLLLMLLATGVSAGPAPATILDPNIYCRTTPPKQRIATYEDYRRHMEKIEHLELAVAELETMQNDAAAAEQLALVRKRLLFLLDQLIATDIGSLQPEGLQSFLVPGLRCQPPYD